MSELKITTCPICGIEYGLPKRMYEAQQERGGNGWYCPNGHSLSFHETELDRMRQRCDRLLQNEAYLEGQITEEKNRTAAYKGQATTLRRRAKAGVCPCCQRTFKQLSRHMANKHPEFDPDNVIPLKAANK